MGCIKSHLHLCPERVKVQAYTSLVGPGLRIRQFCMGSLQDVPKALAGTSTATCCTFCYENIFKTEGCVTQALNYPNWPTLEHRRKVNRLTLMHKTLHGQAAINIPPYVKHQTVTKTRNSDPVKFIPVQRSFDEYKYSLWSRTINDWSRLPPNIINLTSISNFKVAVNKYIST